MLQFLMRPANAVCNAFGITDEHERGMMRMLVNMMIVTAISVALFYVAWELIA